MRTCSDRWCPATLEETHLGFKLDDIPAPSEWSRRAKPTR
jgi:hypothetical protein